jgi:hypothetical protein
MKRVLQIILIVIYFNSSLCGQSVSVSKVVQFLISQDRTIIDLELKKLGFKFIEKKKFDEFIQYTYFKNGMSGKEKINVGTNDELFCIQYFTTADAFNIYKAKLLTDDFHFAYNYKENQYYENESMRIGLNEKSSIISCFVPLK